MLKSLIEPFRYEKLKLTNESKVKKSSSKVKDWKGTLKRIWGYMSDQKVLFFFVLLMVFISTVLTILGPFLVGKGIDIYIVEKSGNHFFFFFVVLVLIHALHSLSIWLQNIWMIKVAQNTVYKMRSDLFRQFHLLPISFFDQKKTGELMSRMTNDVENVSSTLNSSVIQISSSVLTLIGVISVMLWMSPFLTIITLIVVPLLVVGMKWITRRTGQLFKEQQRSLGELNGYIEETITGQRIVKTFSQENRVMHEFLEKNERLRRSSFWAQTISGFIPKLMHVLNNLSFTLIAGFGGIFALKGWITIGTIVVFAEYARQFTRPLNDLANQFNTLLSAVAGAERVFDLLDEQAEEADFGEYVQSANIKGDIVFDRVSFSYGEERQTIKNISFHVSPGETVALVGATGAGKTTIINLLARFYEVNEGRILIDGKDISKLRRSELRQAMGFVLQDPFLFHTTIRENIRYGRLDATDEEVEEAAKLANAHSFIKNLPDQYDTIINEGGTSISQGQKQLLSIARAILKNPSILLLDEATSSIDTVTELKIQEALERLMKGRTSFVIAHRLNTIKKADQIFVIQDGRIAEKGSHDELLEKEGFYFDLVTNQLKPQLKTKDMLSEIKDHI
ncbi:ABC transporter ATP-binding protein [Aeribacillus pallidus]|uniref:ABC transporter ATP-binding protein n=1 Tax=Aeribacillus TaxID=1055323 RepID=UPI0007B4E8E2|nr:MULTISPECIES: ABC transporter ATP-binding protein [Aeribacillus]KZM54516.1 multidrug ABC transporter ATP-binding protein [Aeribacillus pallidus]MED0651311.1 ABC transporter ATP-binding protein [Aeribacillus composti]MED4487359.1 ABC transporter ATP-binding protein [Aeribacillus pallidus]